MERSAACNDVAQKERLAKHIFHFPPEKGQSKTKTSFLEDNGFQSSSVSDNEIDDAKIAKIKYQCYESIAESIDKDVQGCLLKLNEMVLTNISQFIFQKNITKSVLSLPVQEIPTALLSTGFNAQDHKLMFDFLSNYIKKTSNAHIVSLSGSENSRLNAMTRNVLFQLLSSESDADFEYHIKESKYEINYLRKWYQQKYKNTEEKPPVVVIFEDFQSFDRNAVMDFITQCSSLQQDVPISFIFGVPLIRSVTHEYPRHILSLLSTEKFRLNEPEVYLNEIIECLCLNDSFRFHLHLAPFSFLLERFFCHDISFVSFVEGFKYLMLDFFMDSRLSFLLDKSFDITMLSHDYCENIRELPSIRRYIEFDLVNDPQKQIDVLTKDDIFLDMIKGLMKDFEIFQSRRVLAVNLLKKVLKVVDTPLNRLGKESRKILLLQLRETLTDSEDYSVLITQFRKKTESSDLLDLLEDCLDLLQEYKLKRTSVSNDKDANHFIYKKEMDDLLQFQTQLDKMIENGEENKVEKIKKTNNDASTAKQQDEQRLNDNEVACGDNDSDNSEDEEEVNIKKKEQIIMTRKIKMSTPSRGAASALSCIDTASWSQSKRRRVNLLHTETEDAKNSNLPSNLRVKTNYKIFKDKVIAWFNDLFVKDLVQPNNKPLFEVFYVCSSNALKQRCAGSLRSKVQSHLGNPRDYDVCKPLKRKATESFYEFAMTSPYTCIVYRLHQECGKMINLYDLFTSFLSLVSPDLNPEEESKERETLHIQFTGAISELLFMGLIANTKRKTDHVERMTWCHA